MTNTTSRAAPSDSDADVPGHLPEEMPTNVVDIDEEAWMPGRWLPFDGNPVSPANAEKLGSKSVPDTMSVSVDETDSRVEGDGENDGMSAHLRTDVGLGEPGEHDL